MAGPRNFEDCTFVEVEELADNQVADSCLTRWSCHETRSEEDRKGFAGLGGARHFERRSSQRNRSFENDVLWQVVHLSELSRLQDRSLVYAGWPHCGLLVRMMFVHAGMVVWMDRDIDWLVHGNTGGHNYTTLL